MWGLAPITKGIARNWHNMLETCCSLSSAFTASLSYVLNDACGQCSCQLDTERRNRCKDCVCNLYDEYTALSTQDDLTWLRDVTSAPNDDCE